MSIKTILFAMMGLFISMTATVLLMRGDVARMRNEVQAKHAAQCAAQAQRESTTETAPADELGAPVAVSPSTSSSSPSSCATSETAQDPANSTGAAAGSDLDPASSVQSDAGYDDGYDDGSAQPVVSDGGTYLGGDSSDTYADGAPAAVGDPAVSG